MQNLTTKTCERLVSRFNLGERVESLEAAAESQHTVWKLTTDQGSYAVKQLNDVDQKWIVRYRLTDGIARAFGQRGLSVVSAIPVGTEVAIRVDDYLFVIYKWIDGIPTNEPPTSEARNRIANLLAGIHAINLTVESRELQSPPTFEPMLLSALPGLDDRTRELVKIIHQTNLQLEKLAKASEPSLLSHTDLHPSNVLWSGDEPYLIDWEQAGPAYYSVDVVSTAMTWSLSAEGTFGADAYTAFLESYRSFYDGPHTLNSEFAFWHCMGWGLDWLAHNLRQMKSGNPESDTLSKFARAATRQVDVVISTHDKMDVLLNKIF